MLYRYKCTLPSAQKMSWNVLVFSACKRPTLTGPAEVHFILEAFLGPSALVLSPFSALGDQLYYLRLTIRIQHLGLSWWFSRKESACDAGDMGSIPESGRSPGEGNSNPLQYSCQGNPMDRRAWRATWLSN